MILKQTLLVWLFLGFTLISNASTCTIQIADKKGFPEANHAPEMKLFMSLEFEINGSAIRPSDSLPIEIAIHPDGFDSIVYSFIDQNGNKVHESSICKLKSGEVYTIYPCVCCGIFLMTPSKDAKRGFVKFKNQSDMDYIAMSSDFNYDTIPGQSATKFKPSLISMNCGFRPNSIFLANFKYLDSQYLYDNWSKQSSDQKAILRKRARIAY